MHGEPQDGVPHSYGDQGGRHIGAVGCNLITNKTNEDFWLNEVNPPSCCSCRLDVLCKLGDSEAGEFEIAFTYFAFMSQCY